MKSKVVLSALALLFAAGAMAQDCTFFFPQTKGTQLVKRLRCEREPAKCDDLYGG